jgi:two-component system cell cycle response regulator/two-component system cell cycle response regulator DivK
MIDVLLVEDDLMNRMVIEDIIEFDQIAARLICVETGEAALGCAEQLQPALILMDLGLPGINGLETTRRLKKITSLKTVPVWAISAHAMKGDAEHALSTGCCAYFSKPIDGKQLAQQLREFIAERDLVRETPCISC